MDPRASKVRDGSTPAPENEPGGIMTEMYDQNADGYVDGVGWDQTGDGVNDSMALDGSRVLTPRATADSRRASSSRDRGPGISVTTRRSWGSTVTPRCWSSRA
jgi:hypothetical protein